MARPITAAVIERKLVRSVDDGETEDVGTCVFKSVSVPRGGHPEYPP